MEKAVQTCPACNKEVVMVFVHGHYQCPLCRQVTYSCCEGSGAECIENKDAVKEIKRLNMSPSNRSRN